MHQHWWRFNCIIPRRPPLLIDLASLQPFPTHIRCTHPCAQGSSTEAREAAAEGLGEMVGATSADALRPFVVQITGPLIRILGDRFPSQVRMFWYELYYESACILV